MGLAPDTPCPVVLVRRGCRGRDCPTGLRTPSSRIPAEGVGSPWGGIGWTGGCPIRQATGAPAADRTRLSVGCRTAPLSVPARGPARFGSRSACGRTRSAGRERAGSIALVAFGSAHTPNTTPRHRDPGSPALVHATSGQDSRRGHGGSSMHRCRWDLSPEAAVTYAMVAARAVDGSGAAKGPGDGEGPEVSGHFRPVGGCGGSSGPDVAGRGSGGGDRAGCGAGGRAGAAGLGGAAAAST